MSFPRYPHYRSAEGLRHVPSHWHLGPLKHVIARIESGTSVNAIDVPATNGATGVLKTSCVYRGIFDPSENKTVAEEDLGRVSCPLKAGTVIVSRMNTPDLIGAAGVVKESSNHLYLPDRLWQVSFAGAYPDFVHFWTLTTHYRGQIESACTGTSASMKNIAQDQFARLMFPAPPLDEQIVIAAVLSVETRKIDELIAEQRRLIDLLNEKRQAVISHAVTNGLNPDAPMKPSGVEWLGDVPAHWEVGGLTKYLASVVDYRGRTPTKVDDGVLLLTARNIRDGMIDYDASAEYIKRDEYEAVMSRGKVAIGDVLFTTEAPLGQVANVDRTDVALAQRIIKFRGRSGLLHNEFLKYWLLGEFAQADMQRLATGSTALGIKGSKVGQLRLVLPPISEQAGIADFLTKTIAQIESLKHEAQHAITLLQERRTALISAAVTGQIDVRGHAAVETV